VLVSTHTEPIYVLYAAMLRNNNKNCVLYRRRVEGMLDRPQLLLREFQRCASLIQVHCHIRCNVYTVIVTTFA
jgi:hypothetical protein